jgi:PIN domain nuclease of toxin-antitoxin system
MKLLLDTHIWIWALLSPDKLSRRVKRELEKGSSDLYLSPISIWEAKHLERRKRIQIKNGFSQWLERALLEAPLKEAAFTFAVAAAASQIELPESDPGDVFLAATATTLGLTLVTADFQLLNCSWLKTLPND